MLAKDNARSESGLWRLFYSYILHLTKIKYPFTVIIRHLSPLLTQKSGAVLTFVLLLVFNVLCLMVYGFTEGNKSTKVPYFYILVLMYALMALAGNNQQVEQNKSRRYHCKNEKYFKEHGFNSTVEIIIPPVNNDMVNIKFTEKLSSGSEVPFKTMRS